MTMLATPPQRPAPNVRPEPVAFNYAQSDTFAPLLKQLGVSLLVTTYQANKLLVIREHFGGLSILVRSFERPVGLACDGRRIALGTRDQVWQFRNAPDLAPQVEPVGVHDACFIPRASHVTGDIGVHEVAWGGEKNDELWVVNTRFSCLCTMSPDYSFVPRWRPPFISALAPEDRCHLNGLCVVEGRPAFVTALGTTDTPGGWRADKKGGGVLLEVPSGEVVARGLSMPHSPRWYDGRLWLLESGRGVLVTVDPETGERTDVAGVPGFARGLAFVGPFAFIGLSQVREHVFDGLPLTGEGVDRNCGIWIVDLRSGSTVAWLKFEGNVQEIYEVLALPGIRYPEIVEPMAELVDSGFILPDSALADVPADLRS